MCLCTLAVSCNGLWDHQAMSSMSCTGFTGFSCGSLLHRQVAFTHTTPLETPLMIQAGCLLRVATPVSLQAVWQVPVKQLSS